MHSIFPIVCLVLIALPGSQRAYGQSDTTDVDFELESLLAMPVSSAAKYDQKVLDAPASVTIITAKDIEEYGYQTLAEILASQRGFYVSYDRNYDYAGVRGFGRPTDFNNRLLVLIDGTAMNESTYTAVGIGSDLGIPLAAIDRIEIVRGPGSALYGTSAMFAVINIFQKRQTEGVDVRLRAGSQNNKEAQAVVSNRFSNGLDVLVAGGWASARGGSLYFPEYDSPETNNGIARNLDWDRRHEVLDSLGFRGATLQVRSNDRTKGVPTGAWGALFNDKESATRDGMTSAMMSYGRDLKRGQHVFARAYASSYVYDGTIPYEFEGVRYEAGDEARSRWVGGEVQFRWDPNAALRMIVGLDAQRHMRASYLYKDEDELLASFDAPYSFWGAFAQAEYEIVHDLVLTASARRDQNSFVGGAFSPRAALLYKLSERGAIKALYGEAFRAPSPNELYYEDPIADFKRSVNLRPERIRTTELVWEQQVSRALSGSVALFNYGMRDLIDTINDPVDSLNAFVNAFRVRANGVEAELNIRMPAGMRGFASYTLQDAREKESGRTLSNSPRHLLKSGIVIPLAPRITSSIIVRRESARRTVYDTQTSPFLLADAKVSLHEKSNRLAIEFRVRNIFNASYAYPGGFEHVQDRIVQDGRAFHVGLSLSL